MKEEYVMKLMLSLNSFLKNKTKFSDEKLEKTSRGVCTHSESGFGARAVELTFNTKKAMIEGEKKIKAYFRKNFEEINIALDEDKEAE